MDSLDYIIIGIYFAVIITAGALAARKAKNSDLDDYFLGGRKIHWLALSMSGSVSNFDITGTMWMVSILATLGMRSIWHHWAWGFLAGAFFLAYMAKWVRRSKVRTAAEWMHSRFGHGKAATSARITFSIYAILLTIGLVAYAYQGIGKFASFYIPLEQWATQLGCSDSTQTFILTHEHALLACSVIGITTLYVLYGGLKSVVVTDVLQTVILLFGSILIIWIAWDHLTPERKALLPTDFHKIDIPWTLPTGSGQITAFSSFGALVILWVFKGLLQNAGGPGSPYEYQRFLAAKDSRDAAKAGAAWSLFLVLRWGMVMGIGILALTSFQEIEDPEKVLPRVLQDFLPSGMRGLVIAGLLAAFMSTFSSTINAGASYIVCDLWLPYCKSSPSPEKIATITKLSTLSLVAIGLVVGSRGDSIHEIWNWLMIGLTSAVIMPNILRWYWWRFNGWGYTTGCLLAFCGLVTLAIAAPSTPDWIIFCVVNSCGLVGCLLGSLLTAPTDEATLQDFANTVRPIGLWGKYLGKDTPNKESTPLILVNLLLGMIGIGASYLCPMYLVGHWYAYAAYCAVVVIAVCTIMKFTWYHHLPKAGE